MLSIKDPSRYPIHLKVRGRRVENAYGWAKIASVAQKLERLSASLARP